MLLLAVAAIIAGVLLWHPTPKVADQARDLRQAVLHNLTFPQPVEIVAGNRGLKLPDLVQAAQLQINYRLAKDGLPFAYLLVDSLPTVIPREDLPPPAPPMIITDDAETALETAGASALTEPEPEVVGELLQLGQQEQPGTLAGPANFSVEIHYGDHLSVWMDVEDPKAHLRYSLDDVHTNDLPFFLTQTIYDILLGPDTASWPALSGVSLQHHNQNLTVNFVAAEDSAQSPEIVADLIRHHLQRYDAISRLVSVNVAFHTLDVSRRRADASLLGNTSDSLTLWYTTLLGGYADSIQGVALYPIPPQESAYEGSEHGTAYERHMMTNHGYDVAPFLADVDSAIEQYLGLPHGGSANLCTRAELALKHRTIRGFAEVLGRIADDEAWEPAFEPVARLLERAVADARPDYLQYLHQLLSVYQAHNLPQLPELLP